MRGFEGKPAMKRRKRPYGREEVKEAILATAAEMFSKHGVAAVSLRQIASGAKVNLGLIHRHFGSKEDLRLQVQNYLAAKLRDEIGIPQSSLEGSWKTLEVLRKNDTFLRVLARTFLDRNFQGDVQSEFPFVRHQIDLIRREQKNGTIPSDMDPRILTAGTMALGLGLLVFEQYIVSGTGLDKEYGSEAVDKILQAWVGFFSK